MLYFILGTIIGSFLNVVITRSPNNQSIVSPRSHCLTCKKQIPFYHNIPILSYILLKGKCANCHHKISIQYILVETLVGILFYVIFNLFSLEQALLLSIVFSSLVVLSVIDLYHLLIPVNMIIILYILIIPKIFIYDSSIIEATYGALISILYLGLPALFISFIKKNKSVLGFGDILLSIFVGGWLGVVHGIACLFLASVIGIFFVIYFIIVNRDKTLRKIPFGMCISISFIIIILIEKYYNFKLFIF